MYKIHFITIFTFLSLLLSSCGNNNDASKDENDGNRVDTMVIYYYNLRANGHFNDYVASMHSCLNTTDNYKQNMIRMLQHHQNEIIKEKQGVNRVEVIKTTMHDNNKMANVYLNVTFNDSSREEVIFPLVYENGKWLIQ